MHRTEAWRAYRSAFENFSIKARRVQALIDLPNTGQMETALLDMERARLAYTAARDALAQHLLPALIQVKQPKPSNVSGIAELLWEVAGRPEGTAQKDWLRAEEIARTAAA